MAAKTMSQTSNAAQKGTTSDELLFHNDTVSVCLLVNRRHKHLRVIDFRAGPTLAKRNFILMAAKREGIDKVFTLVERDEVSTWMKLGFTREGSIPGFYKRSDAWIMGIVVSEARPLTADGLFYSVDQDDDDLPDDGPASPAVLAADKTLVKAKRLLKDGATVLPSLKMANVVDVEAKKMAAALQKKANVLTGFEPFGRDATRSAVTFSARGASTQLLSWEAQPFFNSAFVEIVASPKTEAERLVVTAAIGAVCEKLRGAGMTSAFATGPSDDAAHAAVFLANGFRRSAVLRQHLIVAGERKDASLWTKKLSLAD